MEVVDDGEGGRCATGLYARVLVGVTSRRSFPLLKMKMRFPFPQVGQV